MSTHTPPSEPSPQESQAPSSPPQRRAPIRSAVARLATWGVLSASRRSNQWWRALRPEQQLVMGFALYIAVGTLLLSLPWSRTTAVPLLDNLFIATSAVSTTGLTSVSVADSYTFLGEFIILALFQLGALGFMTLSSLLIVARGRDIPEARSAVLRTEFSIPRYFVLRHFLVQATTFTLVIEVVGAAILAWRFSQLGVPDPLWSGVFHSVSAFATAGFSLHNDSLERFADDWVVNLTVSALAYAGAVGFIVFQDVYYSLRLRERMITFTTKVILSMTTAILALATILLALTEPSLRALPWPQQWTRAAFQAMSASTTAGFNSVPIGALAPSTLLIIIVVMLVGASPAGTGGGIKTTAISALLANLLSTLRRREVVTWLGHQIPPSRLQHAVAITTLYLILLCVGTILLVATHEKPLTPLLFEAASAIGTVGLSMGITAELSTLGKVIIIALMFVGRCGVLTLGLAMLSPQPEEAPRGDDLAV